MIKNKQKYIVEVILENNKLDTNTGKHMVYRKIESDDDVNVLVSMAHDIWSDHFKAMFDIEILSKLIEAAQLSNDN